MNTFLWHDYETTGADSRRDRPSQFAAIRTTMDLEIIGEPIEIFCQPASDGLPHPDAVMITGITPQQMQRDGLIESEFAARVNDEFSQPGSCGVGYNSLRFDDEFTRHLLYRNFHDPYQREWKDGNSRWDLIDLARMCYAMRPEGIEWPLREDGSASFRLEHLARANHLDQQRAHDALSDVRALIALARLIRVRQPKLFDFYFALRRKQRVFELINVARMTPLVHVSSRYPAARGCLALIAPLAAHPTLPNAVIVVDLETDPTELIELDAVDIADRVFVSKADLPEGIARIPLKAIHANRSPAIAPLATLNGVDHARLGLDVERCLANLERLRAADGLAEKVRSVFGHAPPFEPTTDPELSLYSGFLPDGDRRQLQAVRACPSEQLAQREWRFSDPRYPELLFRYRARNWPELLSDAEQARWEEYRRTRLTTSTPLTTLTLDEYFQRLQELRDDPANAPKLELIDQLESWGHEIKATL